MRIFKASQAARRIPRSLLANVTKTMPSFARSLWSLSVILVSLQLSVGLAAAAALSQGYNSKDQLPPGTLVSLDKSATDSVVAATGDTVENLFGVVVGSQDSLLSLSGSGANTQVATNGEAQTLVSDINGDIHTGDKVTVSPIAGVGMLASFSTKVVGVAQADFNASTQGSTKQNITDKSGKSKSVTIGSIPVLIDVAYYVSGTGDQRSIIPPFIQNLADAIAGKKVSTVRIIVGSIILLLALTIVIILIYGAVRSAIISIGRNPLSASSVRKSLIQVLLVAVAILAVSMIAIALILTR